MPVPVLLDCSTSPYSRLKPVPVDSVKFQRGFWADRLQTIKQITLPTQFDLLESTGRLNNFRRITRDKNEPFRGYFFNDSDVYKWLEAACWSLASGSDDLLQGHIDEVIHLISAAQDPDGYMNTYFTGGREKERWSNLRDMHELYCAGHLIQAAIAHHRVTGQDDLLDVAVRLTNHICSRFLNTGLPATSGHPEIEMALVELYRVVGDPRYLQMAQSFLDQRGSGLIGGLVYHLDHVRFREMEQLEGHAVRAMYLCCGATDIYLETGEKKILRTLEKLWERLISRQMYISGGIGSRHEGESLGSDFELPNARAYAETCAAIGSLMWNWRMLHCCNNPVESSSVQPEVKYADLIEWTLYNAVLPGIGLNGLEYHYVNPLEVYGSHQRRSWFECACCPTNIVRLIASIGGYFYSHSEDNIWIHQYAPSIVQVTLNHDLKIKFSVETDYPSWSGQIELKLLSISDGHSHSEVGHTANDPVLFGMNLRIPGWVQGNIRIHINDEYWDADGKPETYLNISRKWMVGDKIELELPMPVRFLECHPFVQENSGRIAISRGPLLYCIEEHDNTGMDPREVFLELESTTTIQSLPIQPGLFQGININAHVSKTFNHWGKYLYRKLASPHSNEIVGNVNVLAIPYFSWGNRSRGWMQVWVRRE